MPRTRYQPISRAEAITPTAAPVNTYVRPEDPAPSPLHGLAEGLSKFDAGLSQFLQARQTKQDDEDKIRAEAAFNSNNQLGWAEAVRQGKVPANASPVFMKAYKASQGNLAGIQLRDKYNKAYLSWSGRNSNDPAAYQQFLSQFIKDNAGSVTDVDVLRGLNPHIQQLSQDGYGKFSEDSANSVYQGALSTQGAVANHTIDEANTQGITNPTGLDVDALYNDLMKQRAEFIASGGRAEDYDKQMVEAITAKSVEHLDPKLLDLLDRTAPGSKIAFKDYPEFSAHKQSALDKLEQAAINQDSRQKAAQKVADEKRKNELTASVVTSIQTDPMQTIPEETIKELEIYNPGIRKDIAEMRKTFLSEGSLEDPRDILLIQRQIAEGTMDRVGIIKAIASGKVSDPSTAASLLDRVEKFQTAKEKGSGLITSPTAKRYASAIVERIAKASESPFTTALDGSPLNMTDEMLEAQSDYENMLMDWESRNPDASLFEREKFMKEAGNLIMERVVTVGPMGSNQGTVDKSNVYTSDTEAAFQKQQQQQSGAVETKDKLGNAVASRQAPQTETQRIQAADKPPSLESSSEEYRNVVKKNAAELGLSEEEYNVKLWQQLKSMVSGNDGKDAPNPVTTPSAVTPTEPAAPQADPGVDPQTTNSVTGGSVQGSDYAETAAQIGTIIDNAWEAGKTAVSSFASGNYKPVLDLLGHSEGTDKGRGYNETLGYGAYTGGDVNLTTMTIGQVKKLQGEMLRHPNNKWNSSAVGRYQIVRKTLVALQKRLGISDDELFDEKMQDRLAGALLEGRGLADWKAGKITTAKFMDNLSKEWASLPGSNGKGAYSNQRASVSVTDLASAFSALRAMEEDGAGPAQAAATATAPQMSTGAGLRPFQAGERIENADGSYSTERTETFQTTDGEWVNIPSLWMSTTGPVDLAGDEEAILSAARRYEETAGRTFSRFKTLEEAVQYARQRSEHGGAGESVADTVYANIPAKELAQFKEWNSDPVANHEANLKSIDPTLAQVIKKAQQLSKVKFVLGAGKRDAALQKKAVEWGWSKTLDSDHLDGGAADLWPLDENGAVKFDKALQLQVVEAMKQAAKELGVTLDVGADWKSFKDLPHFAVKRQKSA